MSDDPDAERGAPPSGRTEEVFEAALDRSPEERERFLSEACSDDAALRLRVERLLARDGKLSGFLDRPALSSVDWQALDGTDPLIGESLGPYRLSERIGQGGMSQVYLASRDDAEFDKRVAIKLIRRSLDSPETRRRFQSERQILALLEHPHIARLYDGGTTRAGLPFVVMELIEGLVITRHCDAARLDVRRRLELFVLVCDAVQYAHRNLIVHRDIKPSNILITKAGEPKLLDFGIAKILSASGMNGGPDETATESRRFTPNYASPEHVAGRPITTASDVYSLGVVLYELLCGKLPHDFAGRAPWEISRSLAEREPAAPSRVLAPGSSPTRELEEIAAARSTTPLGLCRRLAGDLDLIALEALRRNPEERYGSAEQLARDVRRHLQGLPISARTPTLSYRLGKLLRRHTAAVLAGAAACLLVIGLAATAVFQSLRIAAERDRARAEQAEAELQRTLAEQERRRAEEVTRFLVESFEAADPLGNPTAGPDLTAREILHRQALRVDRLAAQPEVQATLRQTMSSVYRHLGLLPEAEELVRTALDQRRELFGATHAAVAESLHELALVSLERGDLGQAQSAITEALAMRRSLLDDGHPDIARSLRVLGRIERDSADFASAEEHLQESLRRLRAAHGDVDDEVSGVLDDIMQMHLVRGDYDAAEELARQVLQIRRQLFGESHPRVFNSLNSLAGVLFYQGRLDEALDLQRSALDLSRELLGDEHPAVATMLNNLAYSLQARGEPRQAEGLYREALDIYGAAGGEDHPGYTDVLNNLAILYEEEGRHDEAIVHYRESLRLARKVFGDRHPAVATTLHNLGLLLLRRGDSRAAEPALREALDAFRASFGERHPSIATCLASLARLKMAEGELAAAERLVREALQMVRETAGDEQPVFAHNSTTLAEILIATGRFEAAEETARAAERLYDTLLPVEHWRRAVARSVLAASLVGQGRFADAEPMLLASLDALRRTRGDGDPLTRDVLSRLVTLYETWGRRERLAEYRTLLARAES